MIDMVFLDAGETILRPHPSFEELFAATARKRGYDLIADQVAGVREELAPHLIDLAADDAETSVTSSGASVSAAGSRSFWSHLYLRFLDGLGIRDEALADELFATFSSTASYKLYDDVLPALGAVRGSGHRLGLISNFERWLEDMLVELEVGELFDVAIISGVEGLEKPGTGIYELALERAGVGAKGAVHVGDSMTYDIAPASAVGMRTVLLDRAGRYRPGGTNGHQREARPSATIASLGELPAALERL